MKQISFDEIRVGDTVGIHVLDLNWIDGVDVETARTFRIPSETALTSTKIIFGGIPRATVFLVSRPKPSALDRLAEAAEAGEGDWKAVATNVVRLWEDESAFTPSERLEFYK